MFTAASRRRIHNGFFLLLVASSILGGLAELGIGDPFTVVLLTTTLGATAVRRVLDPSPARRCSRGDGTFVATSVIAWFAIGFAALQNSQRIAHYSFYVPAALRVTAAAVLVAEILRPLIRARRAGLVVQGDSPMGLSTPQVIVIAAVCVSSANLVFVALAAAWVGGLVVLQAPAWLAEGRLRMPAILAGARFFAGQ